MRVTTLLAGSLLITSALLGACSSSGTGSPPATGAESTNTCAERSNRAIQSVQAVVEANRACTTDTDCTLVGVAGACFDACSAAVSVTGVDAVKAAIAEAESRECPAFAAAECKHIVPPCVPPSPPVCHAGKCQ
ncbi:hypothetical protein [Polyangium sp. y55x31]|uniref:hypothetical protein n=1 Tax=Polyangium sp. y55x31 TaxID=3042688 RepID=UPI0024825F2C|nr:hypothetical protein [Polyangium sp. y55x31]MDI1475977.1 hypothetical protein [Polyangium sp. y55x31]